MTKAWHDNDKKVSYCLV